MPLFRTKREYFEWIENGQKTVDLRRGKAKQGDFAVFLCGRKVVRKRIIKRVEGEVCELITEKNYCQFVPVAHSRNEVLARLKKLYSDVDGTFTAYYIN